MAIGMQEILVFGGILVFLVGSKKFLDWCRVVGQGKREFDKALKGETEAVKEPDEVKT